MTQNEFQKLTNEMQEKLGKENSSIIADTIGTLISDNDKMNKKKKKNSNEIKKLEREKENLITANGNLLQQVSMGVDQPINKNTKKEEPPKKFSFKSCFDNKGNFKE